MMCSPTKVKKVTLWHPPPIGSLKLDDFFSQLGSEYDVWSYKGEESLFDICF